MKKKLLFLFIIVFGFICFTKPVSAADTRSDLLDQINPYYTYRYSTGDATLGGITYTDCLLFDTYNSVTGYASFDLEGNYKSLSFCTAHVAGKNNRTVTVYCDDVKVWSETVVSDDLPNQHNALIDLTGVKELEFVVSGSPSSFPTAIANMKLVSKPGYTQDERKAPVESNFLTNVQAYNSSRYGTGDIKIGDKTYEGALKFDTYNSVAGHATYNLQGNYVKLSFFAGNQTNSASIQTRTITITGDGEELYKTSVSSNTVPKYGEVSLKDVHQLKISVSGTASSYNTVLAGVNLTSNGRVQSIKLDQSSLSLSVNNPSARLMPTIIPTDAYNQNIIWYSSNPSVATVDETGLVTAISKGDAIIYAVTEEGNFEASCTVKSDMPYNFADTDILLSASKFEYNGAMIMPEVNVTYNETVLKDGVDYSTLIFDSTDTIVPSPIEVGRYKIRFTGKGNYAGSSEAYFTIVPQAPAKVVTKLYGHDDIKVTWSKPVGASGYNVYYKKATASKYTKLTRTTKRNASVSGLLDGVKYTFKIVPYYTDGETRYSSINYNTSSTYTLKKLNKPKMSVSGKKVKVKWNNISGETGYQISRSSTKTGTYVALTKATTSGTNATVSATKGKTYYYKVRAYKVVDDKKIYGPWSDAVKYVRK